MTTKPDVLMKRRALLDAIYAIHAGDGQIRIDERLAQRLDQAWDEYDSALTDELRAEVEQLKAAVVEIGAAYIAAQAEVERLRKIEQGLNAENGRLLTNNADLRAQVERLRAEVERLRRPTDSVNLSNQQVRYREWRAAGMPDESCQT